MPKFFRSQQSFAARLTLWVMVSVTVVLTGTAIVAHVLVRDGILPDDFDAEEEKAALSQELNTQAGAAGAFDLASFMNNGGGGR